MFGMVELKMSREISKVIYPEAARNRDPALYGNHRKIKCILYYLHN